MGDERLLERVCKGDADAVSQLFARYQASIYRYAVHMCGRDAGDDIVQETFLTVMRQPGRYDPVRGPVIGYLFGIARHLALKRLTSSGAASLFEELAEDVETANPEAETALDSLTRTETVEAVRAAVRSLPPQYREVIVLCELQEMDYAAAAGIIQCPIGTVRSRLHLYSNVPVTNGQTVRLELPQAALALFGIEADDAFGTVLADVLVGQDGLARAVRFVRPVISVKEQK